jgi:hypothetical protein
MPMQRHLPLVLLLMTAVALPAAAEPQPPTKEPQAQTQTKTKTKRRPAPRNEYGFLPGYRPPEVAERQDRMFYSLRHPTYWYGWPGWYRGRWNGGGFGPCWTQTPIGNIWDCGR